MSLWRKAWHAATRSAKLRVFHADKTKLSSRSWLLGPVLPLMPPPHATKRSMKFVNSIRNSAPVIATGNCRQWKTKWRAIATLRRALVRASSS
jgi:hypothetical protein